MMIHGSQRQSPRLVNVSPMDGYLLDCTFNNGERRTFDAAVLLSHKAYAPLKSNAFFRTVRVEFGSIWWPGDLDYCPDALYNESVPLINQP